MQPLRWALIQSDWCLCKKRKFGHTKRHQGYTHTKERRSKKTAIFRREERGLRRNQTCQHPDLNQPASRTKEIKFYSLSHPVCDLLLERPCRVIYFLRCNVWFFFSCLTSLFLLLLKSIHQKSPKHSLDQKKVSFTRTVYIAQGTPLNVMWQPGGKGVWGTMDTCICMPKSLCYAPETITLLTGYEIKVLVAQSCLTLCDPMNCSSPGSSVHGM